ncbi:hypothetical protein V7S43_000540 [Phytophthora oleae]|uniref:Uncharacterized protein n=1 Tax=Phytophthora oleae TaxID=2107226 RepID=A0ABD3G7M5_9STRA
MKTSCKQRAFLDAAAVGDLDGVNAWLSARGDVNVTMGERWTALLYAVAHSRMVIVRRLLSEDGVDLNATSGSTTIMGSSALTLALTRKNNSLVALLLTSGASRATIPHEIWQKLEVATWIRTEVRWMLSQDWAVVWKPALHRHFPPAEREKCRLVVYANVLALRQLGVSMPWRTSSSASVTPVSWKIEQLWWVIAALTKPFREEKKPVRWRYLAQPLVFHIIEYAVFLW